MSHPAVRIRKTTSKKPFAKFKIITASGVVLRATVPTNGDEQSMRDACDLVFGGLWKLLGETEGRRLFQSVLDQLDVSPKAKKGGADS